MSDKDFIVKNGLVVNSTLIVANSISGKISFNTNEQEADLTIASLSSLANSTTASVVNSTSDIIQTSINHNYSNGQIVLIISSGTNPTGVSNNQLYYICSRSSNTFTLHSNLASSITGTSNVDILASGSGTISILPVSIRTSATSNNNKFATYLYRNSSNLISLKMQQIINGINLGYVEYNPLSSIGSIAIGSGVNEAFYVSNNSVFTHFNNSIRVGNSTVNSTINSTSYSGTANNSTFSYGKVESALNVNNATTAYGKVESALNVNNATTAYGKVESALNVNNSLYFDGQPQSYYTNASNLSTGTIPNARIISANTTTAGIVQLVDSVVNTSITLASTANSVKNTYDSAIAANTRAASAQSAAESAYSNSVLYSSNASNLSTGIIPNARIISANTTTAGIVQLVDSVVNTSITLAPTANSVKNAYDSAIAANTRAASAQSAAISAYSNAVLYSSNASNLSTGIIPNARIIAANTTTAGIVQLVDSVVNTSITLASTANSVKNAYDSAIAANTRAASAQVTANSAYDSAIAANTRAASAQSAAVSAYSNSINYIGSITALSIDFSNNTSGKILTTNSVWVSTNLSTLTSTNSTSNIITIDLNTGFNFEVTLGSNSTIANSVNGKTGQSGFIRINQDAVGSRIITWGSTWKFAGGTKPTLSTAANASDFLYYNVIANNFIIGNLIKAVS